MLASVNQSVPCSDTPASKDFAAQEALENLDRLDWSSFTVSLDEQGSALLADCQALAGLYPQDVPFRSRDGTARVRQGGVQIRCRGLSPNSVPPPLSYRKSLESRHGYRD